MKSNYLQISQEQNVMLPEHSHKGSRVLYVG